MLIALVLLAGALYGGYRIWAAWAFDVQPVEVAVTEGEALQAKQQDRHQTLEELVDEYARTRVENDLTATLRLMSPAAQKYFEYCRVTAEELGFPTSSNNRPAWEGFTATSPQETEHGFEVVYVAQTTDEEEEKVTLYLRQDKLLDQAGAEVKRWYLWGIHEQRSGQIRSFEDQAQRIATFLKGMKKGMGQGEE